MADPNTQWLIEDGIGEKRAVLIENGQVIAAKLHWPDELVAGQPTFAKLISKPQGKRRGVARLENGSEVLVDHLPPEAQEGAQIGVLITRAPIAECGRFKLAQARCYAVNDTLVDPDQKVKGAGSADAFTKGDYVQKFDTGVWEEVWHSASSGSLDFPGGEILCSVTPAMTLIDVDGELAPRQLAAASIPAIRHALEWFDIGGNIGIDFPTLDAKSDRKAIDLALANALDGWAHERTAMNGFGFVQLVARLEGPSLLHRFAKSRTGMCVRYALRVAERTEGAGVTLLTVHPALKAKLKPEWLDELVRRTGRQVRIESDPGLALEAPHAQVIAV